MRLKLIFLSFFAFSMAQAMQQPVQQTALTVDHPLSIEVDRVNVLFTVMNPRGKLITKLRPDDFKVFEDDQPQNITNFATETDLPLNIALLIDTSGSIRDKLRFEREAAASFFYSVLRPGADRAFIMTFDSTVRLHQDYSDDPAVLARAAEHVIAGGSTVLFDAVADAASRKLATESGRRVIVITSDGVDNSSRISLEKTLEVAQKNDVIIYAISTNGLEGLVFPEQKLGEANLAVLAQETGGRVLKPTKLEDLNHAFQKITKELRSQYSLAYRPTNTRRDGSYRAIRVVPVHKDYTVQARRGYFAPQ
jgi:Ca-activated chloride channel family protein